MADDIGGRDLAGASPEPGPHEWRPIETAPKDATRILIWTDDHSCEVAYWSSKRDKWVVYLACDPFDDYVFEEHMVSHWMPLPEPPRG